ncbi:hypothetical protein [Dactylosporangium sp. CA-233914]|uniref:hypothetical protein n=1 Tax=Dactylosporangium sp. CA-233914 TaxID=3239934 RepID=UPI003D91AA5E
MKRILNVLLMLLLSVFAFAIAYVQADSDQRDAMKTLPAVTGETFLIPDDPNLADPDTVHAALLSAAAEAHVNILRTNVGYSPAEVPQITQYILLTTDTKVYDAFGLRGGHWLTAAETQSGRHYLASAAVGGNDADRVGRISDFGGNDQIAIRPLGAAYDLLPVTGRYIAETTDGSSLDRFFTLFAEKSNSGKTAADFRNAESVQRSGGLTLASALPTMLYFIILLTAVLLVYELLHDAKQVGVMKLNGLGTLRIWYAVSARFILLVMAAVAVAAVAAAWLIPDSTAGFVGSLLASLGRAYAVMLVASLLTCVYISRIKLSDTIKNRKNTRGVFFVNLALKAACSVVVVIVGVWSWVQYGQIADQQATLANWAKTRDYAVFTPTSVGNDLTTFETNQPGPSTAEVYDLYPKLNARGALFIDATNFEPAALASPQDVPRSIQVNPNFLRAYPVRDTSGTAVDIPESTTAWVVMLPEHFKPDESEIMSYFRKVRDDNYRAEEHCAGHKPPAELADQPVRLIWLAEGQRAFSFNPKVYPDHRNEIPDPMIQVMTTANSLGCDRANMITGGVGGALKVKVDGDSKGTLDSLGPDLRAMRLDDNLTHLVTMNEYVLQQVVELRSAVRQTTAVGLGLLIVMLALAAEGLVLSFSMHARKIVVRRLHGVGLRRSYREFTLTFAYSWAAQLLAVVVLLFGADVIGLNAGLTAAIPAALAIAVAIIAVELLFSNTAIAFIERKSLVKVLKGEF